MASEWFKEDVVVASGTNLACCLLQMAAELEAHEVPPLLGPRASQRT